MGDLSIYLGAAGAPVVAALVSALIKPFIADTRFYPAAALLLGILWNLGVVAAVGPVPDGQALLQAAIMGVLTGLAASGLYQYGNRTTTVPDGGR